MENKQRLIDADALAKRLIKLGFYPAIVKRAIEEAPAVEPKHGHWIRTQVSRGDEIHTLYVCSECNDYYGSKEDPGEQTFKENYLFCRRCGAKMDEEET